MSSLQNTSRKNRTECFRGQIQQKHFRSASSFLKVNTSFVPSPLYSKKKCRAAAAIVMPFCQTLSYSSSCVWEWHSRCFFLQVVIIHFYCASCICVYPFQVRHKWMTKQMSLCTTATASRMVEALLIMPSQCAVLSPGSMSLFNPALLRKKVSRLGKILSRGF